MTTRLKSIFTRPSAIYIDEIRRIEEEEERGLNLLNNRFANYLNQIKSLGNQNLLLHSQIDQIHRKYSEYNKQENENSSEIQFNHLRQQLNNEFQNFLSFQIRFQRADDEKKSYKNKINSFSITHSTQLIQQQLNAHIYELRLLKEQYKKQQQNLQSYKNQYNEYLTKLFEYTNEFSILIAERIQIENHLCTLKEEFLFEREYNYQCKQEFECLEKIQSDLNNEFNQKEFRNIIAKIREDYEKYNEHQLSELELFYQIKIETIKKSFQQEKIDNHVENTEQNQILQQKTKQLENNLHHIIEQNHDKYDQLNDEYQQLETQLSQLEFSIENSRANMIHLTSEINTYRCLLINLVQKPKSKPADFTVHFGNGIIWVRI